MFPRTVHVQSAVSMETPQAGERTPVSFCCSLRRSCSGRVRGLSVEKKKSIENLE